MRLTLKMGNTDDMGRPIDRDIMTSASIYGYFTRNMKRTGANVKGVLNRSDMDGWAKDAHQQQIKKVPPFFG